LKKFLPSSAKVWIREQGARLLEIPWNRFDVPIALTKHLSPGKPISLVDVGASQGNFTFSLERYCGLRRALLIEPQPNRIEELKKRFSDPRFSFACAAAASENRVVDMEVLEWDYSSSLLPIRRDLASAYGELNIDVREVIPVRTATLDELCRDFDGPIDLLKVDVQGAEEQVIAGAVTTLDRVKLIWMEVSFKPVYEGSETLEGMIGKCRQRGFIFTHLEEGWRSAANGELLCGDALFIRAEDARAF
jgi:FkbM family methyltransferase